MPNKAKNSNCICDHKDITASQRVLSVKTERKTEQAGEKRERQKQREKHSRVDGIL